MISEASVRIVETVEEQPLTTREEKKRMVVKLKTKKPKDMNQLIKPLTEV